MELKSLSRFLGSGGKLCSNRTFMELKFQVALHHVQCLLRSNRTFMELKSL